MWEYRLNFTGDEVRKIVAHIWELKDIYSDYYFFDENCSYNLLLVLEAGRPGVDLTEALPYWVIPADTVRSVESSGMFAEEVNYRHSKATKIRHIKGLLGDGPGSTARDVAEGRKTPEAVLDDPVAEREEKIRTLDLSAEYLQYLYVKKKIEKDAYTGPYLKILAARSKLGITDQYAVPVPVPPQAGHGTARFTIGAVVKAGATYTSLKLRPANHDLLDPDGGYVNGAAITFMEGEVRYNHTERKPSLERVTFVEVDSISPIDRFFRPISWKVASGLYREEFRKREHRSALRLFGGPGASVEAGGGLLYSFLEPEVKLNGGLEDGYSLGGGVSAGYLKTLTDSWKAQLQLKAASFFLGDSHNIYTAELNQRYTLGRNSALRFDLKREGFDGFYSNEASVGLSLYF